MKYSKKKGYSKRKPYGKKLRSTRKLIGQAPESTVDKIARYGGAIGSVARTVSQMMNWINVETKRYDLVQVFAGVSSAGLYNLILNQIAQGNADNQRSGEKVVGKDLLINYALRISPSAPNTTVGIFVVYDKKPEVGGMTWLDYKDDGSPIAQSNVDNGDRYVTLKKVLIQLNQSGRPSAVGQMRISLNRIHSEWNSGLATDFEKGAIHLIACSDQTGDNVPLLEVRSRYRYFDN